MKGTEKQIKWAEDIQRKVIETIDLMFEMVRDDPRSQTEAAQKAQAKVARARQAVAECESAHDLIEVYGSVKTSAPAKDNIGPVSAAIRNRFGIDRTPAQKKLIGE